MFHSNVNCPSQEPSYLNDNFQKATAWDKLCILILYINIDLLQIWYEMI